jgi:hypothetical protein
VLLLVLAEATLTPEKLLERLRAVGAEDVWVVRARSAGAIGAAEVPVFAGLKALVAGADEDRLVALASLGGDETSCRDKLTKLQLELSADDPPSGRALLLGATRAEVEQH